MQSATEKPITRKGRIGEIATWCIAAISWGISLTSQVGLALDHGFHGWHDVEAVGDGLLPDLSSLAMMALALDQAERGRSARLTWVLSIVSGAFMEWANIAYAWPDPEAVILHSFPPFLVTVSVFVLVHIRRTNALPARAQVIDQGPQPEPPSPRPDTLADRSQERALAARDRAPVPASEPAGQVAAGALPAPSQARSQPASRRAPRRGAAPPGRVSRDARRDEVRALLATPGGRDLSGTEIGARLGIDAGYARKLRAEVLGASGAPELTVLDTEQDTA